MGMSKTYFWITMALCVNIGSCKEFYNKNGETVIMNCGDEEPNVDKIWKHNNFPIIQKNAKSGRQTKGRTNTAKKAKLKGNSLEIHSISNDDFGDYTCNSFQHKLYVASAFASPSSVLVSEETKLSCDIKGLVSQFTWTRPNNSYYGNNKDVTLKPVRLEDAGQWTCQIMAHGKEIMKLGVDLIVVGPLKSEVDIRISPGGDVELPCVLPNPGSLRVKEAKWTRDPSPNPFLTATTTNNLIWNSIYDFKSKFTYSNRPLSTVFNVTIKKVELADDGVYECTLVFEEGKSLSAKLNLKVEGEIVPGSKVEWAIHSKENFQKPVLDVKMWVWIAIGASSLLLVGLSVVIVLVHNRNKWRKRQIRKRKSKRQTLEPQNYCKCVRSVSQPKAGKRVKPPPLTRQHYDVLIN